MLVSDTVNYLIHLGCLHEHEMLYYFLTSCSWKHSTSIWYFSNCCKFVEKTIRSRSKIVFSNRCNLEKYVKIIDCMNIFFVTRYDVDLYFVVQLVSRLISNIKKLMYRFFYKFLSWLFLSFIYLKLALTAAELFILVG